MDYLDPKKERRHHVTLMVGYVLLAVAITTTALVLLYQAYGFGVTRDGTVIQSGLTFFSSHPHPANIYVDGKLKPKTTNTRLTLPSGIYDVKLTRDGYNDWRRTINLDGGSVQHYDYPFLFPKSLAPKEVKTFSAAPGLLTQSPDRRWLVIQPPGSIDSLLVYDLKNPDQQPDTVNLPDKLLTKATSQEDWQLVEWAADNQHILLRHDYDAKAEFVVVDRVEPGKSVNLDITLPINPSLVTLRDKKYDKYYIYDQATATLRTVSLRDTQPAEVLKNVLAYKTYGDDTVLYVTASGAPAGKVLVRMQVGKQRWTLRTLPAGANYVVNLAKYSGTMYVAVGAASSDRVYIYKDPIGQLQGQASQPLVPQQVLHVEQVNDLSFSTSAQFIAAENGSRFGVYDIENKVGFNYTAPAALDVPQTHASWMDGNRLAYVSGGKLTVADYDNLNRQTLMALSSRYLPAFDPDYAAVYSLAPAATPGQFQLTRTPLLTKADQ